MRATQNQVDTHFQSSVIRSVPFGAVAILTICLVSISFSPVLAGNFFGSAGKWVEKRTGVRVDPKTVGKAVEKAVQDTGKTLETAAHDTGDTLEKAGQDTEAEAQRFGKKLDRFGQEVEKTICKIFAPGSDDPDSGVGCSVDAGARVDNEGNVTAYDPNNPSKQQEPPPDATEPSDEQLAALEDFKNQLARSGYRTDPVWYKEVDGSNGVAFERSLFAKGKVGVSPLAGLGLVVSPTGSPDLRFDDAGDGELLSSRNGGSRYHAAFDFKATAGQKIVSPIDGYVLRVKRPGKPGLSGLLLVSESSSHEVTVFYVKPSQEIITQLRRHSAGYGPRPRVTAGRTVIGTAQHLARPYKDPRMQDHVHVHVTTPNGRYVSLDGEWVIKQ